MKTINAKLFLISLASIVVMSVVFIVLIVYGLRYVSYDMSRSHMETAVYTANERISQIKESTLITAAQFATNTAVATGVQTNNPAAILSVLNATMDQQEAQIALVTDNTGRVIARYHSDAVGDFVAYRPLVAFALSNTPMSDIEFYWESPLSIVSAAPITGIGGVVIGSVIVGYDMASDSFVDTISATTGTEVAIFAHNTSVATTFGAGSEFAVGSTADQLIAYRTLAHRNYIITEESVLGTPFLTYSAPIMDGDGVILGIMVLGQNLASARSAENLMMIIALIAALIIAMVTLLVSNLFNRKMIVTPVKRISENLTELSKGNLNMNFTAYSQQDEIGVLSRNVSTLVGVVKDIDTDLSVMYDEYIVKGNIHYNINEDKYQNSFKGIMARVNKLNTQVVADIVGISDAMGYIVDGDFDKEMDLSAWVGEWVFIPKALNSLITNIRAVSKELNSMIESIAKKGDVTFKVQDEKYKGDWRKIMIGLNEISTAIEEPLKLIDIAMGEMTEGNFDVPNIERKIAAAGLTSQTDNYKGIFFAIVSNMENSFAATSSYISELEKVLAQMAQGDLRSNISREYVGSFDLIKNSVNNINQTLNKTMAEIATSADQVLSGSNQIATTAFDLSSGAQQQASSVEELTATIDMISQQTAQNAENAATANDISGKSTSNAQDGNAAVVQMVEAMSQIKESSSNISKIVKTIQDIAFQTNLLALNAAVEAARAGEHGKGFAVVAEEVRSLAARSQAAAGETTTLIQDSISRVEQGSAIAEATTKSLDAIVSSATEVLSVIEKISTASREQSEAISQVSQGLSQISNVTQDNSAVSEETATASSELKSQAEVLRQLVSFFKL